MPNLQSKKSSQRLAIAVALFFASILASFLIAYASQGGERYWVAKYPLARGVQIEASDLALIKSTLGVGVRGYFSSEDNPIGSITRRNMAEGELINMNDLSVNSEDLTSESLSISIRSSDISPTVAAGAIVSLYQVHDARNGEVVPEPVRVLSGVFVNDVSRKSANFGTDLTLTLTVSREDIATLLSATSSGRIVVVTSRG